MKNLKNPSPILVFSIFFIILLGHYIFSIYSFFQYSKFLEMPPEIPPIAPPLEICKSGNTNSIANNNCFDGSPTEYSIYLVDYKEFSEDYLELVTKREALANFVTDFKNQSNFQKFKLANAEMIPVTWRAISIKFLFFAFILSISLLISKIILSFRG